MSHDRGCWKCQKEPYEYRDCELKDCAKRDRPKVTEPTKPMTKAELDAFCRANWNRIPPEQRKRLLDDLREFVPADVIGAWKHQHEQGQDIGGEGFHMFGGGMAVRNRLRQTMKDDELPPVTYPDGQQHQNWDDFYTGALQELAETHVPEALPEDEVDISTELK